MCQLLASEDATKLRSSADYSAVQLTEYTMHN